MYDSMQKTTEETKQQLISSFEPHVTVINEKYLDNERDFPVLP